MSEQIKVGEWVHHDPKDMDGVLLATHHEWAWVDYGGRFPLCELRENLTRIEPAVPQPLFRVGQRVRRISLPNRVGTVVQLEARVNWADAIYENVPFGVLEAVPVCPTCGGKVADG